MEIFEYSHKIVEVNFLNSVLAYAIQSILSSELLYSSVNLNRVIPVLNENDIMTFSFRLIDIFQFEFEAYKKPCEKVCFKLFQSINE